MDVKTAKEGHELLRLSTIPTSLKGNEYPFIILAGEENDNGYNLRQISGEDFFDMVKTDIPSLKRITLTNNDKYTFPVYTAGQNNTRDLPLKNLVHNSDNTLFKFNKEEGSIEILEKGFYDVASWVGIDSIPNVEGEIIISLAKKKKGETDYTHFKRNIISRTRNGVVYNTAKQGTGSSFSFVDEFEKEDKIIIRINATNVPGITVSAGNASLTVSRVDKMDRTSAIIP